MRAALQALLLSLSALTISAASLAARDGELSAADGDIAAAKFAPAPAGSPRFSSSSASAAIPPQAVIAALQAGDTALAPIFDSVAFLVNTATLCVAAAAAGATNPRARARACDPASPPPSRAAAATSMPRTTP